MRRFGHRLTIAVATAWLFTANVSFAQVGYQARSLEWLAADSDIVVRATVIGVESTPLVHIDDGTYRNPEVWKVVTLRVHEVLKGEPVESLSFIARTFAFDRIHEAWREAGQEQLWFLVGRERREAELFEDRESIRTDGILDRHRWTTYGTGWSVIRLGPPVPEERGFRSLPPPIFLMNLEVLEEPADIRAALRAAIEGEPDDRPDGERVSLHAIELPREVLQRSGRSGDANSLMVPVDRRLESLGRRLIEAPETFLLESERVHVDRLRLEGVKALRHFPSEENASIIESLLDESAWSVLSTFDENERATIRYMQFIRTTILESLTAMGSPRVSLSPIVDVTTAVGPVDGWVSRIVQHDDGSVSTFIRGSSQVAHDGWLVRADSPTNSPRQLLTLGPNSRLATDGHVYSSSPDLAALIASDLYLLNVTCDASFPDPSDYQRATGNVVLYDAQSGAMTNLTRLRGIDRRFSRAIAWVRVDGVLLVEESQSGTTDEPSPMAETGRIGWYRMPDFLPVAPDEFPHIRGWTEFRASIVIPTRPDEHIEDGRHRWLIRQHGTDHHIEVITSRDWPPPAVWPVTDGFLVLTDRETGTDLVSIDGTVRIRLTDMIATHVDAWTGVATLRSTAMSDHGGYRYAVQNIGPSLDAAKALRADGASRR